MQSRARARSEARLPGDHQALVQRHLRRVLVGTDRGSEFLDLGEEVLLPTSATGQEAQSL
jgi:hypothetical protein